MSDSNSSPINVHLVHVKVELADAGKALRSKGLVDFNQIKIVHSNSSALAGKLNCANGANSHDAWVNANSATA
jgi:hypothetical protein